MKKFGIDANIVDATLKKDIYYLRELNFNYSLDIGANVGTYSIELSKISKKVIAFEPIKPIRSAARSAAERPKHRFHIS